MLNDSSFSSFFLTFNVVSAGVISALLIPYVANMTQLTDLSLESILNEVFNYQTLIWVICSVFLICKIFELFSFPEKPKIYYLRDSNRNATITNVAETCEILHEVYSPPMLGGRSGHFQTVSYGALGRVTKLDLENVRHSAILKDGTTITFDVFEALQKHPKGDYTLAICPGIANSSESAYIRTLINYAQKAGFRCAVLNHLGALRSVKLTSQRIFLFGGTDEYLNMVLELGQLYPETRFLIVGFSMGANIVTKYLGEDPILMDRTVGGISVCQGYDAVKARPYFHQWQGLRRLYLYVMTENMKHLLRDHYDAVVAPYVKSGKVDEQALWATTSLYTFDECYSRELRIVLAPKVETYDANDGARLQTRQATNQNVEWLRYNCLGLYES